MKTHQLATLCLHITYNIIYIYMYVYKQSYGVPKENGGPEAPTKKKNKQIQSIFEITIGSDPNILFLGCILFFLRGLTHELN